MRWDVCSRNVEWFFKEVDGEIYFSPCIWEGVVYDLDVLVCDYNRHAPLLRIYECLYDFIVPKWKFVDIMGLCKYHDVYFVYFYELVYNWVFGVVRIG